jgi:acyl-CoA synthetase (AMP-forming)/AMP-acid ligase II
MNYEEIKVAGDALLIAAENDAGALTFHLEDGPRRVSSVELLESATIRAAELNARGVGTGDRVGVIGPNCPRWAEWGYAVWLSGATLVPLPIPMRIRDGESFAEQILSLVRAAGCSLVVADPRFLSVLPAQITIDWDTTIPRRTFSPVAVSPQDVAVIQFTSGSTSSPKGVLLSHRAVIGAQWSAMEAEHFEPGQMTYLAWLPFFHDYGLFGYMLRPLYQRTEGHVLPTERFARDPSEWFRLMGSQRVTLTAGPSSAWGSALRAASRSGETFDLTSIRRAKLAAEGISPEVVERFREFGKPFGLAESAVIGAYGMAEATLGITAWLDDRPLRIDAIGIDEFAHGVAAPVASGVRKRVASCGTPMPGVELKVVKAGAALPERMIGEIHVKAPGLMDGYLGENATDPFVDGWLRTGDLGYLSDGELFITGRAKDIIIHFGKNYAPEDFEWAVGRVPGVRVGRVIAFQKPDVGEGEVVVALEVSDESNAADLAVRARQAAGDAIGLVPREVLVLPRGTIPKTTSGKLQRSALKASYQRGELGEIVKL